MILISLCLVRLVVFGDSNCIDGAHLTKPCYWLMDAMLEYTSAGHLPQIIRDNSAGGLKPADLLPARLQVILCSDWLMKYDTFL